MTDCFIGISNQVATMAVRTMKDGEAQYWFHKLLSKVKKNHFLNLTLMQVPSHVGITVIEVAWKC